LCEKSFISDFLYTLRTATAVRRSCGIFIRSIFKILTSIYYCENDSNQRIYSLFKGTCGQDQQNGHGPADSDRVDHCGKLNGFTGCAPLIQHFAPASQLAERSQRVDLHFCGSKTKVLFKKFKIVLLTN
jgi:hypothetical protein